VDSSTVLVCSLLMPKSTEAFELKVPVGLEKRTVHLPEDNSIVPEEAAPGKQLFFDPKLSKEN